MALAPHTCGLRCFSPTIAYRFSRSQPLPPWAKPQPLPLSLPQQPPNWDPFTPLSPESILRVASEVYKKTSQILCSKSFSLIKVEVFTGSYEALYTDLPLILISPPPVLTLGSKTALLAVLQPKPGMSLVRTELAVPSTSNTVPPGTNTPHFFTSFTRPGTHPAYFTFPSVVLVVFAFYCFLLFSSSG